MLLKHDVGVRGPILCSTDLYDGVNAEKTADNRKARVLDTRQNALSGAVVPAQYESVRKRAYVSEGYEGYS
jgi:hypothetical protein